MHIIFIEMYDRYGQSLIALKVDKNVIRKIGFEAKTFRPKFCGLNNYRTMNVNPDLPKNYRNYLMNNDKKLIIS